MKINILWNAKIGNFLKFPGLQYLSIYLSTTIYLSPRSRLRQFTVTRSFAFRTLSTSSLFHHQVGSLEHSSWEVGCAKHRLFLRSAAQRLRLSSRCADVQGMWQVVTEHVYQYYASTMYHTPEYVFLDKPRQQYWRIVEVNKRWPQQHDNRDFSINMRSGQVPNFWEWWSYSGVGFAEQHRRTYPRICFQFSFCFWDVQRFQSLVASTRNATVVTSLVLAQNKTDKQWRLGRVRANDRLNKNTLKLHRIWQFSSSPSRRR